MQSERTIYVNRGKRITIREKELRKSREIVAILENDSCNLNCNPRERQAFDDRTVILCMFKDFITYVDRSRSGFA